jgi:energy-coupling factor transport system substrate-specific component
MLGSLAVLAIALACGFTWYERSHPSARVLALIATLAALAALGRIAFAPLPQIKPTTDIVLLTGYVLGGAPGFAVGAVAAVASNVFFGQGPWTPWQMGGWGLVGVAGAVLARLWGRDLGRVRLAAGCAVGALLYGAIMNFSLWATFSGDHTLEKLALFYSTSLPFDIAHAVGSVLFCLAFGPALVTALRRYKTRFEVTWRPAPAVVGCALAVLLAASSLGAAPAARAAVPQRSVEYLRKAQNPDGGFPGAPGQRSTGLHTGWAGLGLAAAGANPLDVRRAGTDVLDYVRAHASELDDLGSLERTILLYAAAGRPARIGSRDLVGELARRRRPDGSFAGRVNTTAFAVLALRAAGRSPRDRVVKGAGRWLARQANRDGGFNFAERGGPSGVDDTGAALQGLVAAGRGGTATAARAASFLVRSQNADGGFPLAPGGASNAQSTAWAVQGPAGRGPRPRPRALEQLARPAGIPRLARGTGRSRALLPREQADPGLGHRAGGDRHGPQAVPAPGRPQSQARCAPASHPGGAQAGGDSPRGGPPGTHRVAGPQVRTSAGQALRGRRAVAPRRACRVSGRGRPGDPGAHRLLSNGRSGVLRPGQPAPRHGIPLRAL